MRENESLFFIIVDFAAGVPRWSSKEQYLVDTYIIKARATHSEVQQSDELSMSK